MKSMEVKTSLRMDGKWKRMRKGLGYLHPLQGHAVNNLKTFGYDQFLKDSTASARQQECTPLIAALRRQRQRQVDV